VDTKGRVKLADFGCAKIFTTDTSSNAKSVLGTPYW
jgi:serine/threonine protein kinase